MSSRPTLDRIRENILADFTLETGSDEALLSGSVERALCQALTGAVHGLHGRIDYVEANTVPSPTQDPSVLVKHTAVYGIAPEGATHARFQIQGSRSGTADVPTGTRWSIGGATYETVEPVASATGAFTVEVQALAAGPDGNAVAGTSLTLQSSILGVASTASVVGPPGALQGSAVGPEEPADLYERFEARVRSPVRIGRDEDWVQWAKDAGLGITRAWVRTVVQNDPGISVLAVKDSFDSAGVFISTDFLTTEELEELEEYLLEKVPAPAVPIPFQGEPAIVVLTLAISPNTPLLQHACRLAVNDMLRVSGGPSKTLTDEEVLQTLSTVTGLSSYAIASSNLPLPSSSSQVHVLAQLNF